MLPALFIVIAAMFLNPLHVGFGVGLIPWTKLEALGELVDQR